MPTDCEPPEPEGMVGNAIVVGSEVPPIAITFLYPDEAIKIKLLVKLQFNLLFFPLFLLSLVETSKIACD